MPEEGFSRGSFLRDVAAGSEGRIAGARLDVTYQEPLPPDDPLWTAGNVVITSHSSRVSEGSTQCSYDLFCKKVRRYVSGLPLLSVVDKKHGYYCARNHGYENLGR